MKLIGSSSELADMLRAPDCPDNTDRRLFLEELALVIVCMIVVLRLMFARNLQPKPFSL